ncbi:hypothetical protein GBA52_012225 [Prunus armeniaca]|nr:hypothetical protein GBA52_012225 [Prunus armeniaca]
MSSKYCLEPLETSIHRVSNPSCRYKCPYSDQFPVPLESLSLRLEPCQPSPQPKSSNLNRKITYPLHGIRIALSPLVYRGVSLKHSPLGG